MSTVKKGNRVDTYRHALNNQDVLALFVSNEPADDEDLHFDKAIAEMGIEEQVFFNTLDGNDSTVATASYVEGVTPEETLESITVMTDMFQAKSFVIFTEDEVVFNFLTEHYKDSV